MGQILTSYGLYLDKHAEWFQSVVSGLIIQLIWLIIFPSSRTSICLASSAELSDMDPETYLTSSPLHRIKRKIPWFLCSTLFLNKVIEAFALKHSLLPNFLSVEAFNIRQRVWMFLENLSWIFLDISPHGNPYGLLSNFRLDPIWSERARRHLWLQWVMLPWRQWSHP